MADSKISGLTEETSPASTDWVEVEPNAGEHSEKVQIGNLGVGGGSGLRPFSAAVETDSWGTPTLALSTSVGSFTFTADRIYYEQLEVPAALRVTAVSLLVTGLIASSTCRIGLISLDTDGQPLALIADWGTVDTSTTGVKTITSLTTDIDAGWYAVAFISDGAIATRAYPDVAITWAYDPVALRTQYRGYASSQASEHTALSNPPPDWTLMHDINGGPTRVVLLRWEAQP